MRIAKLSIRNFRSFGPSEVQLDFTGSSDYHVIVGPNASGKSNLMDAIRLATLNKYISNATVEPWDFYGGDTSQPLVVRLRLDPPVKYGDTFNRFYDVGQIRFSAQEYVRGDKHGQLHVDHKALAEDGSDILVNKTTRLAKDRTLTDEEKSARRTPRPLTVRDIKSKLPVHFIDGASCEYHLSMRAGSLMSNLGRVLRTEILRDDNMIDWEGEKRTRDAIVQLLLDQISGVLLTDRMEEHLTGIESFLQTQLELEPGSVDIALGVPSSGDLVRKLELHAQARPYAPSMPIARWGRGYSALCAVALFRTLNQLDDKSTGSVVLIEEPEVFLGPHLRAVFAASLQEFAANGNQVFVVTHSPEFYDAYSPESAVLVRQKTGATECTRWPQGVTQPSLDVALKFIEPALSHLIFSKRLLFVEGPDDFAAVRVALELAGVDPAFVGLQVVQLGGKGNAKHLGSYAESFGIPHAYLLDLDAASILSGLDSTGDSWATMDPDLEGSLGTTKQASNTAAVTAFVYGMSDWATLKSNAPVFHAALEKALGHIGVDLP
jgi:energy-coupling factor transporter ATP-binding protein EcfA2